MPGTRRTDAETFALGMWAGTAVNELNNAIDMTGPVEYAAPLTALRSLIENARDTADLATLDRLRGYWEQAGRKYADMADAKAKAAAGAPAK